jgi:hypothetical protein
VGIWQRRRAAPVVKICDQSQLPDVTDAIAGRGRNPRPCSESAFRQRENRVAVQPDQLAFAYDLTLDEARRRAAIVEAIGDDWDPLEVLAGEDRAYAMLYSDLDEEQQRIYDDLVAAGRVPD